jgi:sigma-B regulation protein RsbU (phosphoserine phosphatase)
MDSSARIAHFETSARELNRRLNQAYQQLREQENLARRIQVGLLPKHLYQSSPLRWAIDCLPLARWGGNCYDVYPISNKVTGFFLADIVTRGIVGRLLPALIKSVLRDWNQQSGARTATPAEKLQQLNRELCSLALPEEPLVAMICGEFDAESNELRLSRAAGPQPFYVPNSGEPTWWDTPGNLLGLFDAKYTDQTHVLHAGDKVLFSTHGCDPVESGQRPMQNRRLQDAVRRFRIAPIQDLVAQVSAELAQSGEQVDDFTLLGVEIEK